LRFPDFREQTQIIGVVVVSEVKYSVGEIMLPYPLQGCPPICHTSRRWLFIPEFAGHRADHVGKGHTCKSQWLIIKIKSLNIIIHIYQIDRAACPYSHCISLDHRPPASAIVEYGAACAPDGLVLGFARAADTLE